MVSAKAIAQAQRRIETHIVKTPVFRDDRLDALLGFRLTLKGEHLQHVGAFKARGAANMVLAQSAAALAAGVCTHSSGNHGAALAYIARANAIPAYIVVPADCSASKRQLIQDLGGQIIDCQAGLPAREAMLESVKQRTGALFVPPYDAPAVIAGQGTTLAEFRSQTDFLDAVVVPVGGGGLLAGCCLIKEDSRVYGAEPAGADDAYRSLLSGSRVCSHQPQTICDGLRTTLGALNFDIINKEVDGIFLVSEERIVFSMQLIWQTTKQWVEPSAAVPVAALLCHRSKFIGQHVGVILTGGNVDLDSIHDKLLDADSYARQVEYFMSNNS